MADSNKNFIWYFKKSRKTQIIVLVIVLILLVSIGGYFLFQGGSDDKSPGLNLNKEKLVRRNIDGVFVTPDRANLHPVAVMIENLVTVRPQSGLAKANVVYEALVEGGITRFLAVYGGGGEIKEIAPVRSSRSYYLDWVAEYDALYVHAGGSPGALAELAESKIKDLNALYEGQYFWRDQSRSAPHNLFTSGELMSFALRDRELPTLGNFETWLFKDDQSKIKRPEEEKNIVIDYSSFNYKVEFKYDRENNDYLRYQGEEQSKSIEEDGEVELRAKNVIVQFVETSLIDTSRLGMTVIGEGEAIVFQDGQAINGTWKKSSQESRTRFYDETGEEIKLNAGTTWIEILPTGRQVEYTP